MKFEWEVIDDSVTNERKSSSDYYEETQRAKVIGGWIVKNIIAYGIITEQEDWDRREVSMVFIPDPNHDWQGWDIE